MSINPVNPKDTKKLTPITPGSMIQGIAIEDVMSKLKECELDVGGEKYFTFSQLAIVFKVPIWYFVNAVREDRGLNARKIGKQYIVSARQFYEWIIAGKCEYKPRLGRKDRKPERYSDQAKCSSKGLIPKSIFDMELDEDDTE